MWDKFPKLREVDREKFARDMARPLPEKQYVMYFTPRSGSSWVTDIAKQTKRLSIPGEAFNPSFLPNMTRAYNATTMDEYCDILIRRRNTEGVFGFQITAHQLTAVFRNEADFLRRFPGPICFWLIRKDIVLQAISLFKMQQTRISHAPQTSAEEIAAREASFDYDADAIQHWLRHILQAEMATEELFARAGLQPLRMSYERNAEMKTNHIVNVMGQHIGIPTMKMPLLESSHNKIATQRNDLFADRFRTERREFLRRVTDLRAEMLGKLEYYGPRREREAYLRAQAAADDLAANPLPDLGV